MCGMQWKKWGLNFCYVKICGRDRVQLNHHVLLVGNSIPHDSFLISFRHTFFVRAVYFCLLSATNLSV